MLWRRLMFDQLRSSFLGLRLQEQEASFAQSQTCIQELTTELRNRCLELRELNVRVHEEEKLLQVRTCRSLGLFKNRSMPNKLRSFSTPSVLIVRACLSFFCCRT